MSRQLRSRLVGRAIAVLGGAIRVSTPYLLVSLGETLTEKSGRVNLGLEGTLVLGAMSGYARRVPHRLAMARRAGRRRGRRRASGSLHAAVCNLPRVNDVAVGIALFIFGIGLAFYLGKPFIQPRAPTLPRLPLGAWSDSARDPRRRFEISPLFFIGVVLATAAANGACKNTRWGLIVRMAGDSADAARALGYSVDRIRTLATLAGGFLAGIGGGFLSLYYPGTWNEGLSSGQGLMAIALVIFARWSPMRCFCASLLFGGAIGDRAGAADGRHHREGYYLFNAAPYVLTLVLLICSSSRSRTLAGAPSELSISR